jgi:RNA binding exosome subunit
MRQRKERLFHHVQISVFCKPHDDRERVLKGLDLVSPVPTAVLLMQDKEHDPERPRTAHYRMPDITLTVQDTDSDEGRMTIFTLFFRKMSAVNHFARALRNAMTPRELEEFRDDPAALLDAEGKLSVRLDKDLLMEGKLSLTADGNCYQIKASIAAYPKTEEKLLEALGALLN